MPDCSSGSCACKDKNDNATTKISLQMAPPTATHDSDSDVWGSDSSDDEEDASTLVNNIRAPAFSRDLAALKRRHENRGYLDGLTRGSEMGLQSGFDNGYPLGAQLGGLVGELLADTIWRCSLGQISKETRDEAFSELKINKVLSSEYFDVNLNLENPRDHPIIQKWIRYYDNLGSPMMI